VATLFTPDTALNGFEAFIVKPSTTQKWATSGGPSIATGYYINVFRAHKTGFEPQTGAKPTKSGAQVPTNSRFYFLDNQITHETIDTNQNATGANGTVLVTGAVASEGVIWSGDNTILPPECRWSLDAGATLPGLCFIQIKRPVNASGMTCGL
jgi:hypothetical protein